MSNTMTVPHGAKRRIKSIFTGLWIGFFTAAIAWMAVVTVTFFSGLAHGRDASIWGMQLTMAPDQSFEMMFDGIQVIQLVAAGAALGALIGAVLPRRRRAS